MSDPTPSDRIELIDFGAVPSSNRQVYGERLVYDGIIVVRSQLLPNGGATIGSVQHAVIIHENDPFDMEWRFPGDKTTEQCRVVADDLHINTAEHPIFFRWNGTPKALIIALQPSFLEQVASEAFNRTGALLRTMIAIRDPVIEGMAVAWRRELAEHGSGGKLFGEHLGLALAIHLLRNYGEGATPPIGVTGGLTARRLRQITDYMDAHLDKDISLNDLARIVGLSPHHFSDAFKTSTGQSPYRYLIEQRVRRAKELLLGTTRSITEIALEVGFASHSHFTDQFRKRTKTTPMRYRKERA